MTLAERLAADRRAAVLQILLAVDGHGLNEDLLVRELKRAVPARHRRAARTLR